MRPSTLCVDLICVNILFGDSAEEKMSPSADVACEKEDGSKIEPKNIFDIKYDDLPVEQRQVL